MDESPVFRERCLTDSRFNVESAEADLSTQSTFESENSDSSLTNFKKHPWLSNYYSYETINRKTTIKCRACTKIYSSRSSQRCIGHLYKCKMLSNRTLDVPVIVEDANDKTTSSWADVMVENNFSLRSIESNSFKKWMHRNVPKWKLPVRQQLSEVYLPRKSRQRLDEFVKLVSSGSSLHLSIEFDHWSDKAGRSYLGVIATTTQGSRFLLDLRDVSLKGHCTEVIVEEILDILKPVPSEAINAIMSDSASTCKKARQQLVSKDSFKHVIQYRCLAHLFNLIGSSITKSNERITVTIKAVSKVSSFVTCSPYWQARIKQLDMKKTTCSCPVRWYSTVTMISALLDLKTVIVEEILPSVKKDKADLIRLIDWHYLDELLAILQPLTDCIAVLEKKETSLGDAFNEILYYAKLLFTSVECSEIVMEARRAFLFHMNENYIGTGEFALYIAAYVLNPKFRLNYVTQEGFDLALVAITKVALKSGIPFRRVKSSLWEDFECYIGFEEDYGQSEGETDQLKWWKDRLGNGHILARVAMRLLDLKASTANIERVFSTVRGVLGVNRLKMLPSTLIDIARLKIWMNDAPLNDDIEDTDLPLPQQDERSSLNNSTSSQPDNSTITGVEDDLFLPNWIENEDAQVKRNYQSFFKYFDFSKVNEERNSRAEVITDMSESQIRDCIESARESRRNKRARLEYDSIEEFDAIYLSSQSENSENNDVIECS